MANPGEPVDFHHYVGWRLPVLVIGALLGIPEDQRDHMMELSERMGNILDEADAMAAMGELTASMTELVEVKRKNPGPDVISDLVAAPTPTRASSRREAWRRTPRGWCSRGTRPPSPAWTSACSSCSTSRIGATGSSRPRGRITRRLRRSAAEREPQPRTLRWAVEDFEIAGQQIHTGDLIIISEPASNRDPKVWNYPELFDPTREHVPHLGFGSTPHVCLGRAWPGPSCASCSRRAVRRSPRSASASRSSTSRSATTAPAVGSSGCSSTGRCVPGIRPARRARQVGMISSPSSSAIETSRE